MQIEWLQFAFDYDACFQQERLLKRVANLTDVGQEERDAALKQQTLLLNELSHRVKNPLAMIIGVFV